MKTYNLEIGAFVTIRVDKKITVEADNILEAQKIAEENFESYLYEEYGYYDCDDIRIESEEDIDV